MKKFNLFMIALISMFAFSLGVNAKDVATKDDFISALEAGGDIKVTANITVDKGTPIVVTKDVTLDLNGKNVSFTGKDDYIKLEKGHLNITGTGKMYKEFSALHVLEVESTGTQTDTNYAILTIGKNVVIEGGYDALLIDKYNDAAYGVIVDVYGTLKSNKNASINVNGSIKNTENPVVINVYDGATLTSYDTGIYGAGYAIYNIFGGTIYGEICAGMEIRAGKLNITGGEISTDATPVSVTSNGSGSTTKGAAVAIAQHITKLPLEVKISGGKFKGFSAFYQANPEGNEQAAVDKVKLSITGGDFTTTNDGTTKAVVYSENKEGFITGGTYNAYLEDEYLNDDFEVSTDANGNTIVLDFSGLDDWYERLVALDPEDYTEASIKALEDYMESLENAAPKSQEELDAIVAKLNELTDALETPEEEKARLEREEAEKKANEDKKTNNPDTGDNIYLYVGILTISVLAIGALVLKKRKSFN